MKKSSEAPSASAGTSSDSAIEQRVVQFAEQLGYVVGTIQAKADGWLDREALRAQIASVRDAASTLLKQVAPSRPRRKRKAARPSAARKQAATGRGPVDAPGKRHRKPAPRVRGLKKSDERIAKLRTAEANRQRRKY